jgi:hypothetical protein
MTNDTFPKESQSGCTISDIESLLISRLAEVIFPDSSCLVLSVLLKWSLHNTSSWFIVFPSYEWGYKKKVYYKAGWPDTQMTYIFIIKTDAFSPWQDTQMTYIFIIKTDAFSPWQDTQMTYIFIVKTDAPPPMAGYADGLYFSWTILLGFLSYLVSVRSEGRGSWFIFGGMEGGCL